MGVYIYYIHIYKYAERIIGQYIRKQSWPQLLLVGQTLQVGESVLNPQLNSYILLYLVSLFMYTFITCVHTSTYLYLIR